MPVHDDDAKSVRELDTWEPTSTRTHDPPTARLKLDLSSAKKSQSAASKARMDAYNSVMGGSKKSKASSTLGRPPRPKATSTTVITTKKARETDADVGASSARSARSSRYGGLAGNSRRQFADPSATRKSTARLPSKPVSARGPLASARSVSSDASAASVAPKPIPRHMSNNPSYESHDVILPYVKPRNELSEDQRRALKVQQRVLEKIRASATDVNSESHIVVSLFRECEPDEFGLVSRRAFRKRLKEQFGMRRRDADLLFSLGDPENSGELRYKNFRAAFSSLDQAELVGDHSVRHLRKPAPVSKTSQSNHLWNPVSKNLADMTRAEKEWYHDMSEIRRTIEKNKRHFRALFHHTTPASAKEAIGKTRLPFKEVCQHLNKYGVEIDGKRLKELIVSVDAEMTDQNGITFSQLCRRTDDFFADLQGLGPSSQSAKQRNQELKGRVLGCRRVAGGPAGKIHVQSNPSEFLAHHDLPEEMPLGKPGKGMSGWERGEALEGATSVRVLQHDPKTSADMPWKKRWTEKTVDPDMRRKARKVVGMRAQETHGDILGWSRNDGGVPLTGRRRLEAPGSVMGDHVSDVLPSSRSLRASASLTMTSTARDSYRAPETDPLRQGFGRRTGAPLPRPAAHGASTARSMLSTARSHMDTSRSHMDTSRTHMTTAREDM